VFSAKERWFLAGIVEKALLELNNPCVPTEKPKFKLYVQAIDKHTWDEVQPNWIVEDRSKDGAGV
jgi:hypothetical protein